MNSDKCKNPILELNNVIKSIAESEEFKGMIGNISDKLVQLNKEVNENTDEICQHLSDNTKDNSGENCESMEYPEGDNESTESDLSNISLTNDTNLERIFSSYLLSKDGNNICDCLDKLNSNVERLINIKLKQPL